VKHQKRSVTIPQSVTPAKRSDHSAGLSAQSLPSLTTYAIIAVTRCIFASTAKDILLKFIYVDAVTRAVTRITKSLIQAGQVAGEHRPLWKTAGCPLTP
jgi:hypothetical protein